MSNKKSIMTAWITVIGLAFIVLVMIASGLQGEKTSSPVKNKKPIVRPVKQSPKVVQQDILELISMEIYREHGYIGAEGLVKNISDKSLDNVEAIVNFLDAKGNFVKFDDALIEYNPILSDQTSPFSVMTTDNPMIEKINIDFKYLMGGTIPTKDSRQK